MPIDLTKIKKKINPEPDGQDVAKLRTATVSAINASGNVTLVLNQATISNVPVLNGAVFTVGSSVQVLSYRGSLLVLGASHGTIAEPVETLGSTTIGSTTSTSLTSSLTTTGIHGVTFIAPASGKIRVEGRAGGGSSTVGQYSLLDWEVRSGSTIGSGTSARTTNNNTASVFMSSTSAGQGPLAVSGMATGLVPGAVYNAFLTYASSSGSSTATFNRRYIAVYPL